MSFSRVRKGLRLLRCKTFGQPLDPELQRNVHEWELKFRVWKSVITRMPLDVRLHHEFNLWAARGVGEGMDNPHRGIIEEAIPRMGLINGDRILDLGCGAGLASELMLKTEPGCDRIVGMDISDGMLCHASNRLAHSQRVRFVCGSAEHIPFPDDSFSKILSVEAFYYFEHQDLVLAELQRVLIPEGRLFLLICLYREHTDSLRTVDEVNVPVHVRSMGEYKDLLKRGGWVEVSAREFVKEREPGRKPDVHDRALLLSARKPSSKMVGEEIPKELVKDFAFESPV